MSEREWRDGDIVIRAIRLLTERELTASELGAALWGTAARNPQSYARPAGKLLRRMERDGLVSCRQDGRLRLWQATRKGINYAEVRAILKGGAQ